MFLAWGKISEVQADKGLYRVSWDDRDDVSQLIPRLEGNTSDNQDSTPFDVNEHVVAVMDANFENGVILGAIYDKKTSPAGGNKDKRRTVFKDGSFIEFDRSTGVYKIETKGDLKLKSDAKVRIDAGTFLELLGTTDNLVRHAALNTSLQAAITALNAELVKIATGLNAIVSGSYIHVPVSLNISSAKINEIKTL
jgi:phage baseplate assembly protein V